MIRLAFSVPTRLFGPAAACKLALAAVEKKKKVQEQVAAWTGALARFECPAEIAALRDELLYAPDRNKPETKAFEQACKDTGLSAVQLFARCGQLVAHDVAAGLLERTVERRLEQIRIGDVDHVHAADDP